MGLCRGYAAMASAGCMLLCASALIVSTASCGSSVDRSFRRPTAPAPQADKLALGPSHTPVAGCAARVEAARAGLDRRRRVLVQHFVRELAREGIGDFSGEPHWRSFRRIAAGLHALSEEETRRQQDPDALPLYSPGVPDDLPARVEEFAGQLYHWEPGTTGGLVRKRGDYDFFMKEMVSLLYVFRERPDLLTDEAAFRIIDSGLAPHAGLEVAERLSFEVSLPLIGPLLEYPETENHILMTLSSVYLTNQWIVDNPRGDPRLRAGRYRDIRRFDNAGSELEDMLLQATGRVLHNGFWEVNGRPYQAMTAHALLNLRSFARSARLRTAAGNALDYLAAKFAFQSLEMKRFAPYRRSAGYVERPGMYTNDGVIFMFGALAGGYAWPDEFFGTGNPAAHALWATLLDYRIPLALHDFMLDKHSGFWARMQTRYGSAHYVPGRAGRYFTPAGKPFDRGRPEFLVELYFVTPRFLNAAGGRYNRYPVVGDTLIGHSGAYDLDFLSRPHAIIPRGHLSQWSNLSEMSREVLLMPGEARYWRSDNSGTYKSFSYGYFHDGNRDRHLELPVRIPDTLRRHLHREGGRALFSTGPRSRVRFSFLDLSRVERYGFYVVLGQVSKSENSERHRHYARGFWELVPRERFASVEALKSYVLSHNPAAGFSDETEGPRRYYRYRMTTGELLELDDRLGYLRGGCQNPIRRIWPPGADPERDPPRRLSALLFDRCRTDAVARMPLLDVREVDASYRLTGRLLAYAPGDGQLWVHNPYLGATLHLDSRDYREPRRSER